MHENFEKKGMKKVKLCLIKVRQYQEYWAKNTTHQHFLTGTKSRDNDGSGGHDKEQVDTNGNRSQVLDGTTTFMYITAAQRNK